MARKSPQTTVKINSDTHQRALELVREITQNGWRVIGADRSDRVSLTSIVDEGMKALTEKLNRKR